MEIFFCLLYSNYIFLKADLPLYLIFTVVNFQVRLHSCALKHRLSAKVFVHKYDHMLCNM